MTSIRTFLVVVLISTITLVSFLTALHGYRESMKQARLLFEDQLLQQALILSAIPVNENMEIINSDHNGQNKISNNAFQIFNQDKKLILRSANAPDIAIAEFSAGFSETNFIGYRWHVLVKHDESQSNWIMVAERNDIRHQLADSIILESVFPIVVSIPLTGLLVWLVVSFGLKPIHELASQLRSKQATDLTPLQIDTVPQELTTLAASANDLLQRMERSFAREKRFNTDVAHELRTPIAALKIHLQNLLTDLKEPPESANKLEEGVKRINHLVEQIILLNRMTPDHYQAQFANVDLFDVTRNVIEDVLNEINQKKQNLEFDGNHCEIFGDAFALETMIKNILHNAIKYTPEHGKIVIRIKEREGHNVIQIMDNGSGIPANEYDRVFERFYRLGGDRHGSTAIGCGLGLSIVQYIAELHEAKLHLEPSEFETGLLFTVSFPLKKQLHDMS